MVIAASPESVWEALTDTGELAAWFGAEADLDVRPGGPVRFRWADGTERRGLVIDVDARHVLDEDRYPLPIRQHPGVQFGEHYRHVEHEPWRVLLLGQGGYAEHTDRPHHVE